MARDTENTIAQGRALWKIVDRPNLLIKVPATIEGLPAITALIADGISVNVTIIFSVERYKEVLEAFMTGLELRLSHGNSITEIHSVASFFISRVDSEVDAQLKALGTEAATALLGKTAINNARLAYQEFINLKIPFVGKHWLKMAPISSGHSGHQLALKIRLMTTLDM